MRSHVEFISTEFPAYPNEKDEINPDRFGKRLAEFLSTQLPKFGFQVESIGAEDWGWMVELKNESFPLWVGCGNYDGKPNSFLCFIEPAKPFIRKWLRKIDTSATVERLTVAMNTLLIQSGKVNELRWWDENEVQK